MSTEDGYSGTGDESYEETSPEVMEEDSSCSSPHSSNCESSPKDPDTENSTTLSQLPKLPVSAKQSTRIKLYGRAPNPSMVLNEVEYVLQRRRRPRHRSDLLYEDTFVVARMRRCSGSSGYINVIARVPARLSIPVLNESFDVDAYISSTRVALEVFDVRQHSSDNTVLGRTLLYPRSEQTTFYLNDIIGFAEVFRPKGGDLVVHGVIPGAQACLELACTETCPSRVIPAKMWHRARLFVIKSTLGLSKFPFSPLFLLNAEIMEKTCSDKVESVEEIRMWMDTNRTKLLSLTSLQPLPNSAIDIAQRILSAALMGANAICRLLDDLWEHCCKAPTALSDVSIDIFRELLHAFIRQEVPIGDLLEQIKTMFSWYVTFSHNIKAIDSNKLFTKWIGRLFIKKIFLNNTNTQSINAPTWSRACALESSISREMIDAIYQLEFELFRNQSPSSEPGHTSHPASHMQGVDQLLDPIFKVWLQSFDDAVHVGNYEYVHFMISKGRTKESKMFAPLGLISLSKTLAFSAIDFEVTPKMILQTPSVLSKYINTAPIDWVMLGRNGDMLNGFLSTCLEYDRSSINLLQKTYQSAVSWSIKTIQNIPQQLMPTLTRDHAIAIIVGSMVHGDAEQLSALLDSLQTCTFDIATESFTLCPLFSTTKLFINRSLILNDSNTSTFSTPDSLRAAIERLFSPTIYLFFSANDRVNLLSAVIASNIDQGFIIEMLTTLSSRSSILHCSESECLLQHALHSGKLHVATCLLYDFFVDPTKHMDLWLASLGNYSDDVIMHIVSSLLLRTTPAECDTAITAIYEHTYGALIRQGRFDSLRIINSHITEIMSSEVFSSYKKMKFIDEDIIRLYLLATLSPSGKIVISERMTDDILALIDIFGPRSLASVDVLFQQGSFGLDELLEESVSSNFNLLPDQLLNAFTDIINRVVSILPNLLAIFCRFLDYALSPLTDKEVKDEVKRPSLDFLVHPNNLVLYLLAGENSITLVYEQLEKQLQSADLTWDSIADALNSDVNDKKHQRISSGITCLAIVQSMLKGVVSKYNSKIDKAREFAKMACTQMASSSQSTMVAYLEFLLLQRAVVYTFTKCTDIFTLNFMSAPDVLSKTGFYCPFSMTIIVNLNLCISECDELTRLGAYPVHLIPKEILQQILQVKGIHALCHTLRSTTHVPEDTDIMNIPVIQSYYRLLNALNSTESTSVAPLSVIPKQSVSEQIDSLTETYMAHKVDKTHKSKDDSSSIILSKQFVDRDLLSAPKRKSTFRGDTILHTIFALFDFDVSAEVSASLASILSDTLTAIFAQCQEALFSQVNASYKTPLQMINATSLDHVLLALNAIKKVNPALLSPHVDSFADYPSLVHYFLFKLISKSSEHILSQVLPLVPKAIMRDFLLAPCYSLSNSILLTALLQRGVGDLEYLIDIYQHYGCLDEAVVMPDSGGWCAVTAALQNPDLLEVPRALVEAAMKAPKELMINKYGHTPLHCLFFNRSLVSQTPHKDKGQYVYSYYVLSDTKIDPVFKLSVAQQLVGADAFSDSLSQLDKFGMTPLHYAVMSSAFVCMESLLGKHSSVQLLDKAGLDRELTPLELALARKSEQMVQLLLQKGANPLRRTSMTSFLGEPLTVFARLIQNGYLNLAYTVIYQHSSMRSLLLNEALHANTTNSKPVLRALIDGVVETCVPYLALSISGNSIDQPLMRSIMDSLQCICAGSAKKVHLTNWLGSFVSASPSYWFGGGNSIYGLLVKIANITNFAESNLAFNLRMITSTLSVKLLYSGLRVRRLVSALKVDTDSDDSSVFIEKASPVELMLLKLYYSLCPNIFVEKEFLALLQLYVCKSLHISPIVSRIVLDFLTTTQTGTITKANVRFCSQFFKYLSTMLVADECLVPNLAVKSLRVHTKEFIVKLLGTDEILSRLFTILTLPPVSISTPPGGTQPIIIGKSANMDTNFMEDYIPCCLDILKCYVATNSVAWPLFFSTIYGLHSEMHRNPKMVISHVFNQLNSVDQVSKPSMETLLSAAAASLASLHSKGCAESVICSYLSDLLEAAKQKDLYDETLAQIISKAQAMKEVGNGEALESCEVMPEMDVNALESEFAENLTYIKKFFDGSTSKAIQSTELNVPSIVPGSSQKPNELVDQVFNSVPSQKGSVFYKNGSSLRVDGHCCHFMLVNALPRMNGMLLVFHSYSLKFNQHTDSYVLVYRSRRIVAELKGGCYSWNWLFGYWPEKELFKYTTADQAIKSFYTYFKKKSGLTFIDCCTHGLPRTYYESAGDRKGTVCCVGKDVVGITTQFLEVTPTMKGIMPDIFLYSIASIIADKISSTIVPKLPASESKDWRALKMISSIALSALSVSLSRGEVYSHEDPGFSCTMLILKRALSVYEETILPILDSPSFSKMIKAVEGYADASKVSTALILKAFGMGVYMHELSGLPIPLFPLFIVCSRLSLHYLKMHFANIKLALDGVHRGSMLLLASMHSFAECPSDMSVKAAIALVDQVLGVKLHLLDKQTTFTLQTLNSLPKRTIICRVYRWSSSEVATSVINQMKEFVSLLSKGRKQCRESWINRRSDPLNAESKTKIDWRDSNLLWASCNHSISDLVALLSGSIGPSKYDKWPSYHYNFNFDTTPLYGISITPTLQDNGSLQFGMILDNVSSFFSLPQPISPDAIKVAPGILWSHGKEGPVQEYAAAGFKYSWVDQCISAVSFTPEAMRIQYVVFL